MRIAAPALSVRCLSAALALAFVAGANAGVTTFTFTGGGNALWNDPLAWDLMGVPNSDMHNAVIDANPGAATTLTLNVSISLNDLAYTSPSVQFVNAGRQISLSGNALFNGGMPVIFNGGSITGAGTVNNSGMFDANGNVTFSHAGLFTNNSLSTLTVTSGTLTRNSGDLTNLGMLNVTSSNGGVSGLGGSGFLLNQGVLNIQTGAGGGRSITIDLTNDSLGVVNIGQSTSLNNTSGVYTNRGEFNTFAGSTATLNGVGLVSFNQEDGVFNNGGAFVSAGELFSFTGGSFTGNDIQIQGGTLNITAGGDGHFDVTGNTTFTGGISPNQSVDVINNVLTASDFENRGVLRLTSANGGNSQITAETLTNTNTVSVEAGAGGGRFLTTDLVNNGQFNAQTNLSLNRTSGVYTNAGAFTTTAGSTITLSGSGLLNFNQDAGTLNNNGSFVVSGESFNFNGGVITGNDVEIQGGNLNIATASTGNFDVTGNSTMSGDISGMQSVDVFNVVLTQAEFTNDGTLTLDSVNGGNAQLTAQLLTNNGTLDLLPGAGATRFITTSLDNTGTVNANTTTSLNRTSGSYTNSGQFNTATGTTTTLSGSGLLAFNQNAGALNNNGSFVVSGETFNFNGGVITGNDVEILGGNLNIAATGAGNFDVTGNTTMSGDITDMQTVDVFNVILTQSEFTNDGRLTLDSVNGGNAQLFATMLTNNGTLDLLPGAGATRFVTSSLDNAGTVNANTTTSLNRTSGIYTNTGQFNTAMGTTTTLAGSGLLTFNQNGGVLSNDGEFVVSGEAFNFNGGVITGNDVEIRGGDLNITTGNSGNFDVTGNTTMSGNISAMQTVDVFNVLLTQTDFTNDGTLTLTSSNGGNASLNAGEFTNRGTLDLLAGAGATRFVNASVDNQGEINVRVNSQFNGTNGTHRNNGLIDITSSATLTVGGSGTVSFTNDTAGSIRGDGALSLVSVDAFVNNGLFGPGADDGSNSAGSLQVNGDWSATADAVLEIDIFANDSRGVSNDSINISRDGSLGGDLVVNVLGSPRASDTFVILTAADVLGTFANATSQVVTTNGGVFDVTYTPTQVILSNFVPTPGATGLIVVAIVAGLGRRRA